MPSLSVNAMGLELAAGQKRCDRSRLSLPTVVGLYTAALPWDLGWVGVGEKQ